MSYTCPVCNHTQFVEKFPGSSELPSWKFKGIQYKYVECTNCKVMIADPLPDTDILKAYYNESYNYNAFSSEAIWKKLHSVLRINYLNKYLIPDAKILDFGCGHGYFVREASKKYKSFGFDIGSDSISMTHNGSITYSYDFHGYSENDFDLITAWHVIEHLSEPLETIKELKSHLKPGGVLAIAVPNISSLGFKLCGEKWNWVQPPLSHIFHYNPSNLPQLLEKAGFEILKVETKDSLSNNFFDILITKLFFSNKPRGSVKVSLSKVNSPFYYHMANILRCLFVPFSIINLLSPKSGSELRVIARKN